MDSKIVGGIFALLGIIFGALLTYFLNRSQQKFQINNELNIWKRNHTIEVISKVLVEIEKLNYDLIQSDSFKDWSKNLHENILPLILIHLGYISWSKIYDEIVKLHKIRLLDLKTKVGVKKIQTLFLEWEIKDDFIMNLKPKDFVIIDDFLFIIQVNIQTIMTEYLRKNFNEFKNLDYRQTPKLENS